MITKFLTTPSLLVAEIYLIEENNLKLWCARMENSMARHPSADQYPWLDHSWRFIGDKELIRTAQLIFAPLVYDPFAPEGFKLSKEMLEDAKQNNLGTHSDLRGIENVS